MTDSAGGAGAMQSSVECVARGAPEAIRVDLHMLILFGARERTEQEYRRLRGAAGLWMGQVFPTASPTAVGVIEATPAEEERT